MSTPRSLELQAGVQARRLVTTRGEFACLEAIPAGWDPSVRGSAALLLPGWTGSKEDFLSVLGLLAGPGRRVVAVDLRGQYETPGPDDASAYALDELGADAVAIARTIDAGPVHLVGHSFGGFVARAAVLAAPDAFASLTLLSSGPSGIRDLKPQESDLLRMMIDAIPTQGLGAVWEAKRAIEVAQGQPAPAEEIVEFLQARFLANNPTSLRVITQHVLEAPDLVDDLAKVDLPKLVAYGADDDGWAPELQARMAERLDAQHEVITGAGHSAPVDRPMATAEVFTHFWDEASQP
ncbi:alpha/beta fold hydrolase [Tenggerimyces flavus]|uniref:Alpha/beta fold hydrolase n=1 Tax=Tenggerimyces flavus TaxID=1708749 RepID=A0ABV7YDM4_9ACTN|nr:alpha/beta hydrolase [Tenggerimyces flavus]MBM7786052.1 pimeloyl-ACP methyl ester carboxylesterase [Tenggerimyces flavus]